MVHASLKHAAGCRSQSVLVVDDDEYVLGTLEATLRGLRVHLLTASTAAEGEALALQHRPVLAIVDVGLPDRNGYRLAADLRLAPSLAGMRILILTGQSPDEIAARHSGVNGLILKPFRLHHFLDLVREQLGSYDSALGLDRAHAHARDHARTHARSRGEERAPTALAGST
ncbi:MAG: response regulator [Candidatus Limnocylindrales bacterium]